MGVITRSLLRGFAVKQKDHWSETLPESSIQLHFICLYRFSQSKIVTKQFYNSGPPSEEVWGDSANSLTVSRSLAISWLDNRTIKPGTLPSLEHGLK